MHNISIRFKKVAEGAVTPKQPYLGDAGYDLVAIRKEVLPNKLGIKYWFGLELEIPFGYAGFIFPRSSVYRTKQMCTCAVAVIDATYRGEISAIFTEGEVEYEVGERCAQIVVAPVMNVTWELSDELTETARGKKGYGSTGRS